MQTSKVNEYFFGKHNYRYPLRNQMNWSFSYSRQLLSNKVSPVLINPARKTGVSFALNRTTIPSPRVPQQSPVQAKNKIKCKKKKKKMPHTSTLVTVVFLRIRTRDSSRYMLVGVLWRTLTLLIALIQPNKTKWKRWKEF